MGTDGQDRQARCWQGRHEMGRPHSTEDIDENGDIVWVRECAWCGTEEAFTLPDGLVEP